MLVSAIQNPSGNSPVGLKKQRNLVRSMQVQKDLAPDSFSKEKVDSVAFKGAVRGVIQATVGTAAAGTGAMAAGGAITVVAAPVVVPVLIVGGLLAALHGIIKTLDD